MDLSDASLMGELDRFLDDAPPCEEAKLPHPRLVSRASSAAAENNTESGADIRDRDFEYR